MRSMPALRAGLLPMLTLALAFSAALAQRPSSAARPAPASRAVYLDRHGVIRWRDDHREVALFGANYTLPSASDYRAAGYLTQDRKRLVDEDMAQFARMGWDGLRLCLWGDYENSDRAGNLLVNDHLDLADYVIARARERGIYILLTPITTYQSNWPDALRDTSMPGFSNFYRKGELGTNPRAIAAQANYIRQLLDHVNPYTGVAWKDEPAILFVELINEPWHHPEDLAGSMRYINALAKAVRSTGSEKLLFYNVSQDFRIGRAIRESQAQGVSFAWYPTGLNSGHELKGNYLRTVDDFPGMLRPELRGLPRIVYEFDSPDLRTGYMYPAMVRTFRSVGAQFASMFAYDMLETSSRNLGWQTHYLNLVYTPRKAMSAIIAAEAMRRLPRFRSYGTYPRDTIFGDFRVSYAHDLGEMVTPDAFLYAGSTHTAPPRPAALRRIAGYGSSPLVRYEGKGIYFLDRVRPGVWRLEVYPDAVAVRDPFVMPSPDKVVTRAIYRSWPMQVNLPGLGGAFTVQPITAGNEHVERAEEGRFAVRPGVYVLSRGGEVERSTLPAYLSRVGLAEFHAPRPDSLPVMVESRAATQYLADRPAEFRAQVVDTAAPDSVLLYIRPTAGGFWRSFAMRPDGAYQYRTSIPAGALRNGPYAYVITVIRGKSVTTFPGRWRQRPSDWNWHGEAAWKTAVVPPQTPLALFTPARDAARLAFSRIGDGGRRGLFRLIYTPDSSQPAFHIELPVNVGGISPRDYTASLVVKDRVAERAKTIERARDVRLRLRGLGARQLLHVTLVEADGTSWTAALPVDSAWSDVVVPLSRFRIGRGVMLPEGFPGEWNYWLAPAAGRGGPDDHMRLRKVERLQLSLRREPGFTVSPGSYGVEVEGVWLDFAGGSAHTAAAP